MAKQKVRATRHNGRKGENGVFKAGHNDRSFDVDAAEHIDPSRSFMNVYWDMSCIKDITLPVQMG